MSKIFLDTSAYSAFFRNHPDVVRSVQAADAICLNAVVVGELLAGFKGGSFETRNRHDLQLFLSEQRVDVLSVDQETAERYAVIRDFLHRAGQKISPNDYWIAASVMQHSLTLVTLDKDFERLPQILVQCFGPYL